MEAERLVQEHFSKGWNLSTTGHVVGFVAAGFQYTTIFNTTPTLYNTVLLISDLPVQQLEAVFLCVPELVCGIGAVLVLGE